MAGFKNIKSYKVTTPDNHVLHLEESGYSDGLPALFIHGGPGAGIGHNYHWPFTGLDFRLIAFDQRGCGRSQPYGCLEHNTISLLIEDMEQIRQHFGIDKWLLFGGSWGTTLALAYAIKHPNRVSAMVLRGIFLGRDQDAEWFISPTCGASQVFQTEYQRFLGDYPASCSKEVCKAFYQDLTSNDVKIRMAAAIRWFNWEGHISRLVDGQANASDYASNQQIYTLALFECHYLLNHCFFAQNYLVEHLNNIAHIPTSIIHGRYDMVCKCESAVTLHKHLPNSSLDIIEDAGHSMTEEGIAASLVEALRVMEKRLRPSLKMC